MEAVINSWEEVGGLDEGAEVHDEEGWPRIFTFFAVANRPSGER